MTKRFFLNVSAMAVLVAAPLGVARAADEAGGSPSDQGGGITDIVVTAQHVEESAQRAAIAINVVSGDELVRQAVSRPEDLSKIVPALSITNNGGPYSVFFVRGVGNSTLNAYSDPGIAFNYDGVYIGRPSSTSGTFYDLERVEVLKGPQGTLYGRNATGGAINVIPRRPKIGETSAELIASYGNYNALSAQGAVNLGVSDSAAVRVSGNYVSHDPYMDDGTGDLDEFGLRAQLALELSPGADLRIAADYAHQGGVGSFSTYLGDATPNFGMSGFTGYTFNPTDFGPKNGILSPESQAWAGSLFVRQAGRAGRFTSGVPYNDNDYWGVSAELNVDIGDGTLSVLPAYREADLDNLFTAGMNGAKTREKDKQTSLEVRYAGNIGDKADIVVGGYYFGERIKTNTYFSQFTLVPYQDFETQTDSYAAFGKLTYELAPGFKLTAAGRYTWDKKKFDGVSDVYILFCGNPGVNPPNLCPTLPFIPLVDSAAELRDFYADAGIPVVNVPLYVLPPMAGGSQTAPFVLNAPLTISDQKLDNEKFTYRLAAEYEFSPTSMIYASYETGYHSGGFAFAKGLETYDPETLDAWTIGSKNRFANNTVQLNIEGFYWKYHDQQISQFGYDLGTPPTTVFLTRNIGQATMYGFDADLQWLATRNTMLGANIQYLHSNYDSFVYYVPNQGPPPPTTCGTSPTSQVINGSTVSLYEVDCSGKSALNSPKWSINLFGEQTIPVGDDYKFVVQANGRYRSAAEIDGSFNPYLKPGESVVANASVAFGPEDDKWSVTAFVNNIGNDRRLSTVSMVTNVNAFIGTFEPPRTYGVRVAMKLP
ncbi:MAG: TonB-dependent receptor [Sphingomonadales bacterium 63-6]|nr:MAG: TonB-dependent receptor [Sphingomonadales bacterium 63-6]